MFWMTPFSLGRILEASLFSVFGLESHSIYSNWLFEGIVHVASFPGVIVLVIDLDSLTVYIFTGSI